MGNIEEAIDTYAKILSSSNLNTEDYNDVLTNMLSVAQSSKNKDKV